MTERRTNAILSALDDAIDGGDVRTVSLPEGSMRRSLTEAQIQAGLIGAVKALGGATYHTAYSIRSAPGYPDLTCALGSGAVIWLEVKGPRGRLSDAQVDWLERLGDSASVVWPTQEAVERAAERWPLTPHRSYEATLDWIMQETYP